MSEEVFVPVTQPQPPQASVSALPTQAPTPQAVPVPVPVPVAAVSPAPVGLGTLMAALGQMAPPPAVAVPLPAVQPLSEQDKAAILAEMPDVAGEAPATPQFSPQPAPTGLPGFTPVTQAAVKEETEPAPTAPSRRSRREERERQAPPEPVQVAEREATGGDGDDPPDQAIADISDDLQDIADELKGGRLPIKQAVIELAELVSDACLATLDLHKNTLGLMAEAEQPSGDGAGGGLSTLLGGLGKPPASQPAASAFTKEEVMAIFLPMTTGLSLAQIVTGVNPKAWAVFARSLPPQAQEVLKNILQHLPALVEQAHGVLHEKTGFSAADLMQGMDPKQVEEAVRSTGLNLPALANGAR